MYESMFYMGIVFSVIFFLLSVFLFFYNKIVSVCRYFTDSKGHPKIRKHKENRIVPKEVAEGMGGATEILGSANEPTEKLGNDFADTEVLNKAQDFATALLEADKTEIL